MRVTEVVRSMLQLFGLRENFTRVKFHPFHDYTNAKGKEREEQKKCT